MRSAWMIFALAWTLSGCCGNPLYTVNRLGIDGVIHSRMKIDGVTQNKVVLEMAVNPDGGHLIAVPLGKPCEGPHVAVVDVDGILLNHDFTGPMSMGENPVSLFREKLDAIRADPSIKAVVVRINTPGGSVTATDILWRDLMVFKERTHLPVVACLMDVAAGGGYYLATAADVIVAHPTTVTGGIGVILNVYNLEDLMGQFSITSQEIKSGKHIDMGTSIKNLPEDVKVLLERMATEYHDRFKEIVRKARPKLVVVQEAPAKKADNGKADNGKDDNGQKGNGKDDVFDGRVYTARAALERGLVDRLGYMDDAVALAGEMGGCGQGGAVLFRRANDPARSLYAVTPNTPLQATMLPFSVPGLDRTKLPTFLYLWQPEATLPRLGGR